MHQPAVCVRGTSDTAIALWTIATMTTEAKREDDCVDDAAWKHDCPERRADASGFEVPCSCRARFHIKSDWEAMDTDEAPQSDVTPPETTTVAGLTTAVGLPPGAQVMTRAAEFSDEDGDDPMDNVAWKHNWHVSNKITDSLRQIADIRRGAMDRMRQTLPPVPSMATLDRWTTELVSMMNSTTNQPAPSVDVDVKGNGKTPDAAYFIVCKVGLAVSVDEDCVAAYWDKREADDACARNYPPCGCDSMCPCPWYSVVKVAESDWSDSQRDYMKGLQSNRPVA